MVRTASSLEILAREDDIWSSYQTGAIDGSAAVRRMFSLVVRAPAETELKDHLQERSLLLSSEAGIGPEEYGTIWEEVIRAKRENTNG
jgi:hypothetical protein